jgi:hypothetical protein
MRHTMLFHAGTTDLDAANAAILELLKTTDHVSAEGAHWVHMTSGWTAVTFRIRAPHGIAALEAKGATVWPHPLEGGTMSDEHHKEKVPDAAGISSSDTPFYATKKLAAALGPLFDPRVI